MSTKTKVNAAIKRAKKKVVVYDGPESDSENGGITQSLLGLFMCCRERFRLRVVEGLAPHPSFNKALEYGNMWHLCEEKHRAGEDWLKPLLDYATKLTLDYRTQQEEVNKWFNICKIAFPIYLDFWKGYKGGTSVMQEETFKVPYVLPSGRTVYLRGKWDGVSKVGKGLYLNEHKTKGEIKEEQLQRQLSFDLQTMFYLVALEKFYAINNGPKLPKAPIKGVIYNVVRRPLSGGKGSIRQHKPTKAKPNGESLEEYFGRLRAIIAEEPAYYFMRWKVDITANDIATFESDFLVPILEQLCDWWNTVKDFPKDYLTVNAPLHYRTPYGFYSPLAEGRTTETDEFLLNGSEVGLERNVPLFGELD